MRKSRVELLTEHRVKNAKEGRHQLSNVKTMIGDLSASVPEGESIRDEDSWREEGENKKRKFSVVLGCSSSTSSRETGTESTNHGKIQRK